MLQSFVRHSAPGDQEKVVQSYEFWLSVPQCLDQYCTCVTPEIVLYK